MWLVSALFYSTDKKCLIASLAVPQKSQRKWLFDDFGGIVLGSARGRLRIS